MAKREPTEEQKYIIENTDCPMLVIAGPGTGKTFTLVKRIISIIKNKKACPDELLIITFTKKAAKELVTRISQEFSDENITNINLDDMYISTFHSFCLRIIKENNELCPDVSKNAELLMNAEQFYFFKKFIHIKQKGSVRYVDFAGIEGSADVIEARLGEIDFKHTPGKYYSAYSASKAVCSLCEKLTEELADANELQKSNNEHTRVAGKMLEEYCRILKENDLLTPSILLKYVLDMLENESEDGNLRNKFKYIMVDEYQDTDRIQEKIIDLLSGRNKHICVVGDDDQSLYRFRGATVENILKFADKYIDFKCEKKPLSINFRSTPEIVKFYSKFIKDENFKWGKFRLPKKLKASKNDVSTNTVVKIIKNEKGTWKKAVYDFIKRLKETKKITDYNQVAFLCHSVKNNAILELQKYLSRNGIPVYSPRSNRLFDREEIKAAIGCMFLVLDKPEDDPKYNKSNYEDFKATAEKYTSQYSDLKNFLDQTARNDKINISYTEFLYHLFAFEPFKSWLQIDIEKDYDDLRPARNLARLTKIFTDYEKRKRVYDLKPDASYFFNYLSSRIAEGDGEYEPPKESAPSGYVSFMTIHQSKGLEFPVVICDSLTHFPNIKQEGDDVDKMLSDLGRKPFEPIEKTEYFDFYREYYTAFSRAKTLLVLTCLGEPSWFFINLLKDIPDVTETTPDLSKLEFDDVEAADISDSYSFTSDILMYEACPRRYKYFNKLGFELVRSVNNGTLFGKLIHQTIEDMHKYAKSNGTQDPNEDMIKGWLEKNCDSLSKLQGIDFNNKLPAAKEQVMNYYNYVCKHYGKKVPKYKWHNITDAEKNVSLPMSVNGKDYIMKGTIDMVREYHDYYVIFDIKSGKKNDALIEKYKRQLRVYAHMLSNIAQEKNMNMILFFTGETGKNAQPQIILKYDDEKDNIKEEIHIFSETVGKIMDNKFDQEAQNPNTCTACDLRFFCGKDNPNELRGYTNKSHAEQNSAKQGVNQAAHAEPPKDSSSSSSSS